MTELEHLTPRLPVEDLGRTLDFYRDRLGFRASVLWPEEDPTFAVLERDGTSVAFFRRDESRGQRIGYAELYVGASDVRAIHARLVDRVPIEWGPAVYSYGCREFGLRDPDGYLIIFTEPTEDPPTTEEPL